MGMLMLTCNEASRLQSAALDRRLSFRERVALAVHTAMCNCCRSAAAQMNFLRAAVSRFPGPDDGR